MDDLFSRKLKIENNKKIFFNYCSLIILLLVDLLYCLWLNYLKKKKKKKGQKRRTKQMKTQTWVNQTDLIIIIIINLLLDSILCYLS